MAMKRWIIGKPDTVLAKNLADEIGIDPFVSLIATVRGIEDAAELEQFLSPEPCLCDPRELADITLAADIVNSAIKDKLKIAVYGDYDCDGVVSTTLMRDYLVSRGADVITYIPDRIKEGYGMNIAAVNKLKNAGVQLIITVDNGISSYAEIEYANSLGIKTVVTDHHIPPEILPPAAAIVDPHRIDCNSQFKEICGAQVAFKLCCVLDDKEPEQLLGTYADILSVATVGDVMPLVNENRVFVREGVNKIRKNPRAGITAILNSAGIDRADVTSSKIAYAITPRINAAGRMGSADRALTLLCTKDMLEALRIAGEIDDDNSRRQQVEREISELAFKQIDENGFDNDRVIIVSGDNWHMGVTGIVASRICEKYGKPAIVLSFDGESGHGSGRSFEGFNLYDAILSSKEHLTRFGGHALAAGVSIEKSKVEDFRKAINDYAVTLGNAVPELKIDFRLNPASMSVDMAHAIKVLEPFGHKNPVPVFAVCGVKLEKIVELSGGKHLKLFLSKGENTFNALLFGTGTDEFCFNIGDILDLAVTLDANYFKGEYSLSVIIKAIRKSDTDEEEVFLSKFAFEDFMSNRNTDTVRLLPTREQVGEVYKYLKTGIISEEKIKYYFLNTVGYAKTKIALKTLFELDLIGFKDGGFYALEGNKTDLNNSKTYNLLNRG